MSIGDVTPVVVPALHNSSGRTPKDLVVLGEVEAVFNLCSISSFQD